MASIKVSCCSGSVWNSTMIITGPSSSSGSETSSGLGRGTTRRSRRSTLGRLRRLVRRTPPSRQPDGDEKGGAHPDHVGHGAPQEPAEDDRGLEDHQVGAECPRKDPAGNGLLDAQVERGHRHEPRGAENGQRHGGHRPLVDEGQEHRATGRDDAGHGEHGVEREALVQPGQHQGGADRASAHGGEQEPVADRAEAQHARAEQREQGPERTGRQDEKYGPPADDLEDRGVAEVPEPGGYGADYGFGAAFAGGGEPGPLTAAPYVQERHDGGDQARGDSEHACGAKGGEQRAAQDGPDHLADVPLEAVEAEGPGQEAFGHELVDGGPVRRGGEGADGAEPGGEHDQGERR